ncbi:MAG: response regulator transcription factor [Bdellovibrionaceae bacterium]|nr:response regulator transcription factor [Pseudobdellovibrionaceae bacterium]
MMPTVLAVDDSREIHPFLKTALGQTCSLLLAGSLREADDILTKNEVHLILLDVGLPDGSGFDFCTNLQSQDATQKIPVIFLTGKVGVGDKVLGLALGAEDYVTKPFDILELRARVESKLKKFLYNAKEESYFQRGNLKFELSTYSIYLNELSGNQKLSMTPIEFKLLLKLARAPGYVLSRDQLIDSVWGDSVYIEDRSVDRHISSIRKKLGGCSNYIRTVPGLGYQFLAEQQH